MIMLQFRRPILAANLLSPYIEHTDENILVAMQKLRYPVLATLKKDGIRALRLNGSLLSRTLKPIPNKSIRERSLIMPGGFDMELWNPSLRYDEIESIVMSREHPDSSKIQFHVLDWFGQDGGYQDRWKKAYDKLYHMMWNIDNRGVILNKEPLVSGIELRCFDDSYFPRRALCAEELFNIFLDIEQKQGEGICFRLPNSLYKQGRSTIREQYLVKLARYTYEEAIIVGFIEQVENGNSSLVNKLGLSERSSCANGMSAKNTLGTFVVEKVVCKEGCIDGTITNGTDGERFTIGTGVGLTDKLRKEIWHNQSKYLGKQITFKYKGHGTKDLPRCPIFVGFRGKEI